MFSDDFGGMFCAEKIGRIDFIIGGKFFGKVFADIFRLLNSFLGKRPIVYRTDHSVGMVNGFGMLDRDYSFHKNTLLPNMQKAGRIFPSGFGFVIRILRNR